MTPEQETLVAIRFGIDAMPEDDRIRVMCIAATIRNATKSGGQHGAFALALIGAEYAADNPTPRSPPP